MPSTHPARQRFLDRVNFYGQAAEFDLQGRVLIQPRLRDSALMLGEVDVLGQQNFLEVWNHERFVARLISEPFTDDDAKALSDFGI
jgi:MraZ protein